MEQDPPDGVGAVVRHGDGAISRGQGGKRDKERQRSLHEEDAEDAGGLPLPFRRRSLIN